MAVFASTTAAAQTDGVVYALNVTLPAVEADLGVPVPMTYSRALMAVVEFAFQGLFVGSAYVVLQTDVGDGVWIDVAWCSTGGAANFAMNASADEANAVVQQSRTANSTPSPLTGSNPIALGARFRFTGKGIAGTSSSSSSSSSGAPGTAAVVTIRYKLTGLR